jgi:hypothetical protein
MNRWQARAFWTVRWGGLAAAVVIAGILVCSGWCSAGWDCSRFGFFAGWGEVEVYCWRTPGKYGAPYGWWYQGPSGKGEPLFNWLPWCDETFPHKWEFAIPIWVFLVLAATPTGVSWRGWVRAQRRLNSGRCRACGYDLSGNPGAMCPECGRAGA